MKNKIKPLKALHVFIIGAAIIETLVTITVLGLYFAFSSFPRNSGAIYLSATAITIYIIMVLSIVISTKVGKKLVRPLTNIRDAAQKVICGDFSVRLPVNSAILEVNDVAADFNVMVKELGNTEMLKDDFIANVSHEFKTPLSVIEGYVTLLQGDLSQEEKDEYIDIILKNTEKLSTLTGNILALSKLEHRSISLEMESFRIDKQICEVMVDFNELWEKKSIDVEMDLERITVYNYRSLLTRVWSNLMQNAIKFSNPGGNIKIICSELDGNAVITFADCGIGMSAEIY